MNNTAWKLAKAIITSLFLCALTSAPAIGQKQENTLPKFTIGTGGKTGLYYPSGGLICQLINSGAKTSDSKCIAKITKGSLFNIDAIRHGDFEFGLVQNDLQREAYLGEGRFAGKGPLVELRTVLTLYIEQFTILANSKSSIKSLEDLKGKRLNIGLPGSGQHATVMKLIENADWDRLSFITVPEYGPDDQSRALCAGEIDALVNIIGHPNLSITEASLLCETNFVSFRESELKPILEKYPYYVATYIPGSYYMSDVGEVNTFGTRVMLVTRSDVPDDTVYNLTKAVFDNIDTLKKKHPLFKDLSIKSMLQNSMVPFHNGALKYYSQMGYQP